MERIEAGKPDEILLESGSPSGQIGGGQMVMLLGRDRDWSMKLFGGIARAIEYKILASISSEQPTEIATKED